MRHFSESAGSLEIDCRYPDKVVGRVVYLLEPVKVMPGLEDFCQSRSTALVSVFGMDWDNDLTPWPAPNVRKKCPDFGGGAGRFLEVLGNEVVPMVEDRLLGLGNRFDPSGRSLVGISLAGLFAVWASFLSGLFGSIASVSGSFWYDGFTEWIGNQLVPPVVRRVYLSVGEREKESRNPLFSRIEGCTAGVRKLLESRGLEVAFELNPGNHIADGVPRLRKALDWLLI